MVPIISGAVIRRLDDGRIRKTGSQGTCTSISAPPMKNGRQISPCSKDWIGTWNLKKWPDVTEEEMNGLRMDY